MLYIVTFMSVFCCLDVTMASASESKRFGIKALATDSSFRKMEVASFQYSGRVKVYLARSLSCFILVDGLATMASTFHRLQYVSHSRMEDLTSTVVPR